MILPGAAQSAKMKFDMASLIDVVFLLLIYFMVTASLIKREADLSFLLPSPPQPVEIPEVPVEVLIEVRGDGVVEVEGQRFADTDRVLDDLVMQVAGLKKIAEAQSSEFFVNILPHKEAQHGRIIDVMDACSAAGVEKLTFNKSL